MADTKIEWADRVWNPVTGCTKVSEGCRNCYAERMAKRLAGRYGYPKDGPFKVTLHDDRMEEPLTWRKRSRVFVCSMGDFFHEDVPADVIIALLNIMALACDHTYLLLTKRPERAKQLFQANPILENYPIWLGVTAEDQEQADKRIPLLLQTPAAVRFVSIEPMLGQVDLMPWLVPINEHGHTFREIFPRGLDWVIVGGESGPGARPMHPAWVRSVRDQCQGAKVPLFFKQWGEWAPYEQVKEHISLGHYRVGAPGTRPQGGTKLTYLDRTGLTRDLNELNTFLLPEGWAYMARVGKARAGNELDGQRWQQFPEEALR